MLRLLICSECRNSAPVSLGPIEQELSKLGLNGSVSVGISPCLEKCDAPVAMTLQMDGGASYVFSGIDPEQDATDIAATCKAYLDHADGWIQDARPCGRLRYCLTVRVPA